MNILPKEFITVSNSFKSFIFWTFFSLIISFVFLTILILDKNLYIELARENTNTELLTAIFYLAAGIIFLIYSYKEFKAERSFKRIIFSSLFALFFLLIAFEEESWGQWFFNFEVPNAVKKVNQQNEFNIHNLEIFIKYPNIIDPHRILNSIILLIGIIVPLLYNFSLASQKFLNKVHFPVMPICCLPIFMFALIYEKLAGLVMSHYANPEIMEFMFSIGIILFSISHITKNNYIRNFNKMN